MRVPVMVVEPFSLGRGPQFAPGDRLLLDDTDPSQRVAFERGWVQRRRIVAAPPVDRMVREPVVAKAPRPGFKFSKMGRKRR